MIMTSPLEMLVPPTLMPLKLVKFVLAGKFPPFICLLLSLYDCLVSSLYHYRYVNLNSPFDYNWNVRTRTLQYLDTF
jgi:hypothetical protein